MALCWSAPHITARDPSQSDALSAQSLSSTRYLLLLVLCTSPPLWYDSCVTTLGSSLSRHRLLPREFISPPENIFLVVQDLPRVLPASEQPLFAPPPRKACSRPAPTRECPTSATSVRLLGCHDARSWTRDSTYNMVLVCLSLIHISEPTRPY